MYIIIASIITSFTYIYFAAFRTSIDVGVYYDITDGYS